MYKVSIVCLVLLLPLVLSDTTEDSWIQPNAWEREDTASKVAKPIRASESFECSPQIGDNSNNAIALTFYKKLIRTLFNRNKLQYDKSIMLYERSMHFIIKSAQLEMLEKLTDARDLDNVVTEILTSAKSVRIKNNVWSFSDILPFFSFIKDLFLLLQRSEFYFFLFVTTAMLSGWHVHRRYGIGIMVIIIGSLVLYGYFFTYLECNRRLEIEHMLEVIERNQQAISQPQSMFSYVTNFFWSKEQPKPTQGDQIRKASKLHLTFCRPDHVVMLYVNDLFLKQLEVLLEKCTVTIFTLRNNLPFPFNYMAAFMLIALIAYILKLTFKYILTPSAWVILLNRPSHQERATTHSVINAKTEDRISGENLKLLLTAACRTVSGSNVNNIATIEKMSAVSGVQEILDELMPALSASSTPSSSPSSASTSIKSKALSTSVDTVDNNNIDTIEINGTKQAENSEKSTNSSNTVDDVTNNQL